MDENLVNRLRSLAGMIPQKHKLPSGADTVICSLEAFMQIKELARGAADALEERSKPRWIPVTERPPEDDCQVLAYYGFDRGDGYLGMKFMQVLDYYARDPAPHFQHEGLNGMKVSHWMPLPEPPKEET